MTLPLKNSLTFLLGFGCAFLPAYGPFVGLLMLFSERWELRRADMLWLAAALFLALPLAAHEGARGLAFGALQVGAVWLVYRAFWRLSGHRLESGGHRGAAGWGLVSGLFAVVLLGWLQVEELNFAYKTLAEAIVWETNPALYGHTVLALGLLMAILLPRPGFRVASLGLAALGILAAGSREAAIAWVAVSLVLLATGPGRPWRTRALELGLLGLMLALASGLGPLLGWGRVGFLVDLAPMPESGVNLFQGTEVPAGDWWDALSVTVGTEGVTLQGQPLTAYAVAKQGSESWLRLQQVVRLEPHQPYTLSVWLRPEAESQPGLQGWGRATPGDGVFVLSSALTEQGWQAGVGGPGELLGSGVLGREGEWTRVYASFVYTGEAAPLYWYVGVAPDRRGVPGGRATFAGVQLERGAEASPYRPGAAARGLGLGVARTPYWQLAWQGFLERPFLGWGTGAFPGYVALHGPSQRAIQGVPAHAHNLVLQTLFERGLVGVAGLALLLGALAYWALRRRDGLFLLVFAALLFANTFDTTFFYGGVIYPLAAVAGWRAGSWRARSHEGPGKQVGVTLALAAADVLAALPALLVALSFSAHAPAAPLFYALLLWPAMSWREGLYPGYGLTPPQELRRQMRAAAAAGLIFSFGALIFPAELGIGRLPLAIFLPLAALSLPVGRAVAKRLLAHLGLWGRPVVVLGAGSAGGKVVQALRRRPLDGLTPTAIFDDDPAKQHTKLHGVRVRGPLEAAFAYAEQHGVQHVIVAIPTLPPDVLGATVNRLSRAFKQVQFVPELGGLPADDVSTSHLAGFLALEFRNGLYSRRNRLFKRSLDLLGGVGVSVLLSPLLLALYLWVRLDSPGPAFHWSERVGQFGRRFSCLKFRTMHVDAEARLAALLAQDPAAREEYERYHKLENDPRVTRAGRILRKFSLDELSQLHNVLKGEMSLVGPRPYLVRELPDIGGYGEMIFQAKPGMTGHWQVSARNTVTFGERLEIESYYVRNWSVWWDVIILLQTLPAVLARKGAS